ncbi:hypothetical protein MBOU_16160 [Mycobacterium bourgelatii]|uniref:AAA domain-containing protein n=2 Tax=Mycobacterium bourgelatii TaxID=1273442 RepID=A0A7I9YLK8_MYCBU|nr:hypothetical protein MBOU_16160 [Mycobacterium bourgelatii]
MAYGPWPSPTAPTPAGIPLRMPPRERGPGGTSLDVLEHRTEMPASPTWRDRLYRLAHMDAILGNRAAYERGLQDEIRTGLGSAFSIAVLNLKGGVGKTSVVEALGSTFAEVRDDRVIAVDADADAGDLADRHGRKCALSMADLVSANGVTRYEDVRAHTFMNGSGLEVLRLPDYAHSNWRMERQDFVKTFSILRNHYSVVLVDCPKALRSNVMEAVLPESRALVVVTSTSIDAIHKTRTTLEWLYNNGYQRLVRSTVLAVNHVEPTKLDLVAGKELEQLAAHVAAAVMVPFDRHVRKGRDIALERLSKESRYSYLEIAAALARLFPRRHEGPTRA